MRNNAILKIGNPRRVQNCLKDIVDQTAIDDIESEIGHQVQKFFELALQHYRTARTQTTHRWRQKISRLYYAAYTASRMIRYYNEGHYSVDASDHKKIGKLPNDFPNKSTYANQLDTLREDRNTCDYDHSAIARNLLQSCSQSEILVSNFLKDTKQYLEGKGIIMQGRL